MSFSYDRYDRRQSRRGLGGSSQRTALGYWLPLAFTVTAATVGLAAWVWSERKESDDDNNDDLIYDRKPKRDRTDRPPPPDAPPSFQSEPRPGETAYGGASSTGYGAASSTGYGAATSYYDATDNIEVRDNTVQDSRDVTNVDQRAESETVYSRVSGAIRRTPSPQQIFDGASKRVAAGVAAAGAVVGKGLSAIREQSDDDYQDHERWSEEAQSQPLGTEAGAAAAVAATAGALSEDVTAARSTTDRSIGQSKSNRRLVAIVVSAASNTTLGEDDDALYSMEHASILAHLPTDINTNKYQLVILIYAPHLKSHPLSTTTTPSANDPQQQARPKKPRTSSSASSYSNISTPGAFGEEDDQTQIAVNEAANTVSNPPNALYTALVTRAMSLVESPSCILPFTTPTGHIYMLRHLAPSLVYLQESLTGVGGDNVKQIEGWVGQVVVVIGGEGLGGGLVDTETEDESAGKDRFGAGAADGSKWWMDEARVGLGKGVDVVEGSRVEEDWVKRVGS